MLSSIRDYMKIIKHTYKKQIMHYIFMALLGLFRNKKKLDKLIIIPTNKCNLKCKGCFEDGSTSQEMSADLFRDVLRKSKKVRNLIFMGGEIMYENSPYWNEIFKFSQKNRMHNYVLITNGTGLTRTMISQCVRNNILLLISLDGLKEIHDSRRGSGVFKKIAECFFELKQQKALFGIITTVTCFNYEHVLNNKYVEAVKEYGASFLIYLPFYLSEYSCANELELSENDILNLDRFVDDKGSRPKGIRLFSSISYESRNGGCTAGSRLLCVEPNGDVLCCVQMGISTFNIKDGDFNDCMDLPYYMEIAKYTCVGNKPCMIRDGAYSKVISELQKAGD